MARVKHLIPFTLLATTLALGCATTADPPRTGGLITLVDQADPAAPFVIQRSTLDDALRRGPNWFVQQIAVQPVLLGDGQFYGFRVRSLFRGYPEATEDGVRPGDIVQRVNGQPIERPDQFMSVWPSLGEARHISVRVIRDGKPLLITWAVHEDAPTAVTSVRR